MAVGAADRVIANRYALKTRLGPSELGRVWHAQDTLLGREVVGRVPWSGGIEGVVVKLSDVLELVASG